MNEIEKAIKTINSIYEDYLLAEDDRVDLRSYDEDIQEIDTILRKALQEKADREKGCDICNNHKPLLSLYTEYSIEVEGNEMSVWNGLKCEEIFKINHCPMCGRKLVEE